MNNTIFQSFRFKTGTTVWKIPIRFWEISEPIRCVVTEDVKEGDQHVYAYDEEYGHNVYLDRQSVFYSKEAAIKAIALYAELYKVYKEMDLREWLDVFIDEVIKERTKE